MFRILLGLILVLFSLNAQAANQWRGGLTENTPVGSTLINDIDTVLFQRVVDPLNRVLAGYRKNLVLTYSSASTISVTPGEVTVSNSAETIRLMMRMTSSSNVTFSNIDTGAEASATTYYVYCGTSTATDSTCTFYISASATAPSGVTYYKRLGSFYNDASSNISSIVNDDVIGQPNAWSAKSTDVVYQALTGGYVVGYIQCDDFKTLSISTDSSSSPSTVRQIVGCQSSTTSLYSSFSVPVIAGDYYTVTSSGASDVFSSAVYFVSKN